MTQTEVSPYPTHTAATWGPIFAKLKSNQHHEWKCHCLGETQVEVEIT